MEFETVIKTRRSVRAYAPRDVPEDALGRVLDAARSAPSANNKQPWRFIVVKADATRQKIAKLAADQAFIAEAPVVIVCCGKRYIHLRQNERRKRHFAAFLKGCSA